MISFNLMTVFQKVLIYHIIFSDNILTVYSEISNKARLVKAVKYHVVERPKM